MKLQKYVKHSAADGSQLVRAQSFWKGVLQHTLKQAEQTLIVKVLMQ